MLTCGNYRSTTDKEIHLWFPDWTQEEENETRLLLDFAGEIGKRRFYCENASNIFRLLYAGEI